MAIFGKGKKAAEQTCHNLLKRSLRTPFGVTIFATLQDFVVKARLAPQLTDFIISACCHGQIAIVLICHSYSVPPLFTHTRNIAESDL